MISVDSRDRRECIRANSSVLNLSRDTRKVTQERDLPLYNFPEQTAPPQLSSSTTIDPRDYLSPAGTKWYINPLRSDRNLLFATILRQRPVYTLAPQTTSTITTTTTTTTTITATVTTLDLTTTARRPRTLRTDGERAPSLTPFSSAALLLCYRVPALLHLRRPVGHGLGPVPVRPAAGELPGDLVATDQYVPLFSVPRDRAHPAVLRQHVRHTGARRTTPPPSRPSASSRSPGGAGTTWQTGCPRRRGVRSSVRFGPVRHRRESVRGSRGDLASSR